MDFLNWDTNQAVYNFFLNNIVLLGIVKYLLTYIGKKTPWTWDDDLGPALGGLIDKVKRGKDDTPKI